MRLSELQPPDPFNYLFSLSPCGRSAPSLIFASTHETRSDDTARASMEDVVDLQLGSLVHVQLDSEAVKAICAGVTAVCTLLAALLAPKKPQSRARSRRHGDEGQKSQL